MVPSRSYAARGTIVAGIIAVILILFAAIGWRDYRTKANGPESTIGKSGEMKSPGGPAKDGRS
jgi:hypothetical protein